jgi:hypothetical protein
MPIADDNGHSHELDRDRGEQDLTIRLRKSRASLRNSMHPTLATHLETDRDSIQQAIHSEMDSNINGLTNGVPRAEHQSNSETQINDEAERNEPRHKRVTIDDFPQAPEKDPEPSRTAWAEESTATNGVLQYEV